MMDVTAYSIASRFIGVKEVSGTLDNPFIMSMLQLDQNWPQDDEVPWCSAFVNYVAWLLRLPRSKSLSARSWLGVGTPISIADARPGFDVVILSRGDDPSSGHVGFFARVEGLSVWLLGGNQDNSVSLKAFSSTRLLGVRRLG